MRSRGATWDVQRAALERHLRALGVSDVTARVERIGAGEIDREIRRMGRTDISELYDFHDLDGRMRRGVEAKGDSAKRGPLFVAIKRVLDLPISESRIETLFGQGQKRVGAAGRPPRWKR